MVASLASEHKVECIIRAYDFSKLKEYLHKNKIEITNEYLFIKSICIKANKSQLDKLTSCSQVDFIYSVSSASMLMHVAKKVLNVESVALTGQGVNIAFIDTGINSHLDFVLGRNRIIYFKDFIENKTQPYDDNGHGSFVSGVCSGSGACSCGKLCGIAPRSNIISLKALNGKGEASADKILDAMQWVYENHKEYDIKVVCMSFGSEPLGYNDPIMSGAEALWREGVIVVAAAGNSGPQFQTIKSPGVSSKIITVGGFDDNRIENEYKEQFFEIAEFSSRGPAFQRFKPDLVAPSVDIISCSHEGGYCKLSGTSVATPMIAGLVCLLLEKDAKLTPDQIKRMLLSCCKGITFNHNLEGYGYPHFK